MRTLATAVTLAAFITLAGCSSLPEWFQATDLPDGTSQPSGFEDTIRTASEVAPAFGPLGMLASTVLGAIAGIAELQRRKERAAKDRVADGLRVVAGAIDAIKDEDLQAATKVVDKVKMRSTSEVKQTIDHVRGTARVSELKRAGV